MKIQLVLSGFNRTKNVLLIAILFLSICAESSAQMRESDSKTDTSTKPKTPHSFTIATATPGGTFYKLGYAIAALVTEDLRSDLISMTAMNTNGSQDNVKLLLEDRAQFALLQGFVATLAPEGAFGFDGRAVSTELRAIAPLWLNVEHFVILRNALRKSTPTIADLNLLRRTGNNVPPDSKPRFSIGKDGSGTRLSGLHILEAVGVRPEEDFELQELDYGQSAEKLINREIEGMNTPGGLPVVAVKEAFKRRGADIVVLKFNQKHLEDVNRLFSADNELWSMYTIESGTYSEEHQDAVDTIAQPNFLVVREEVAEDIVCEITKLIYSNQWFFQNVQKSKEHILTEPEVAKAALKKLPIRVHPGATRYYENIGKKKPCVVSAKSAVNRQ